MKDVIVAGIQQLGVGIPDVEKAFAWYRKTFGMDIPVFREAAEAPFMTPYTGGGVQSRDATLAVNIAGGGGFEIWQYTSRIPEPPSQPLQVGDLGIFSGRIKSRSINRAYQRLSAAGKDLKSGIIEGPEGEKRFTLLDPYGNVFQVVESPDWFTSSKADTGGVEGAMIGVSDIERAREFYGSLLGYDTVVYDVNDFNGDLANIPGGEKPLRRVLLSHSQPRSGAFSRMFGRTRLELVQSSSRTPAKIFADRYWGDLGFIHLCFDINGMDALKEGCESAGHPFTVDSGTSFDMGEAGGRFAYIEDPDGTLIEFVETHKLPIMKSVGWYLDLTKRDAEKPLPNWMLRMLGLGRVKE